VRHLIKRAPAIVPAGPLFANAASERRRIICQNEQQPACQNDRPTMNQVIENIGAGEGNRTLVISLEGCCSTIELHPRQGTVVVGRWKAQHDLTRS
jgi:hypothetical protein